MKDDGRLIMELARSESRPSLGAEVRSLWAVVVREWIIFRRYPSWILSLIIWPIIFPAAYILSARALAGPDGSGVALFARLAGTDNYMGYIVVGTAVWMWQNMTLWSLGFALRMEQMRGTLETNWLSPTRRFWFLLGNGLSQTVQWVVFMLITALEFGLLFGIQFHGNPALALLVIAAALPATYGVAFAFASLVMAAREANAFVFLVRGIIMVFCGITYPVAVLPGWMQTVAAWLPPTYMIRGIRTALLTPATLADVTPDLLALLVFGMAWLVMGYLMFRWTERRARRTGTLGQY
jgi:ABC-2 type transport system permease protein